MDNKLKKRKCNTCKLKVCPAKCFDVHEGSLIAMTKLIKKSGKKVYLITDEKSELI